MKLRRSPILQLKDPNAEELDEATYVRTSRGHWYSADGRWLFVGRRRWWSVIPMVCEEGGIEEWEEREKACRSVGLTKEEFETRREAMQAVEAFFPTP